MAQRHNHRSNPIMDKATVAYIEVANKHGLDVCQMALAFALSRPFMGSVIIGATNMEQLKTDVAAKDTDLNDSVLADIASVYRQYPIPY